MQIEELKTAIASLSPEERRRIALYILELEKVHLQKNVGSQISEDLKGVSKVIQEAIEKLKQFVAKS